MVTSLVLGVLLAQTPTPWPLTRAERTNYAETSHYADVVSFLDSLQRLGAPISVQMIGKSQLGKDLPLVVCHQNPNITPAEARRSGKPIVYVQANIHAGEVEGKESALILLRELAQNPKDPILSKLVLLVAPIYNIDGNDKFGTNERNRGHQDGPAMVGERANGQGFDLNRDCIKAESHEFRAILKHVWGPWDPDAIFDLHTTNGTRHGYVLTYSPGLTPTCDPGVMRFTRDELLPKIRRDLKKKFAWELFDYGNVETRDGSQVFATFGWEPRYVTNYGSVRNRISILSEAASFQPFQLRVQSTTAFVRACLEELARNDAKVVRLTREADRRIGNLARPSAAAELGIRFALEARGTEKIILEIERPAREINPMKAPEQFRSVEMPVFDRFKPVRTARFPVAYLMNGSETAAAELLQRHGVRVETLREDWKGLGAAFVVEKKTQAGAAFQGHRLITLEGTFQDGEVEVKPGTFLIRAGQPLGLLAFHMLEPESQDGLAAWEFFGQNFGAGTVFPVVKAWQNVNAAAAEYRP